MTETSVGDQLPISSSMPELPPQVPATNSLPPSSASNSTAQNSSGTSRRSRARKSDVWNHFETLIVNGEEKAQCLHCGQRLASGSKIGTSSLRDHIQVRCSKKNAKVDVRQQLLNYNRKLDGTTRVENHLFSQDVSRKELANMVIMHEYPLSIVDHIGFQRYSSSLNPNFKLISRNTLRSDIMKMFASEKARLRKIFEDNAGRIAITTDMWTASHQKKGYMAVTAHFIDQQWNLYNKIVRFAYVPSPHTTEVLAEVLLETLSMFNIHDKISAVVVDNHITNDGMLEVLRHRFDSSNLLLDGALLHVRCSAHILNLVVQDGLDIIASGIKKLRDCVSFWAATPKRVQTFEDKARILKIDCSKKLVLDCKTRWNSTYVMLQIALPYKDIFCKLKIQYPRFSFEIPTDDEWKWAANICDKLARFYKVTEIFSGRSYPTANLFFRRVCQIKLALMEWLSSSDKMIQDMALKMVEKFDKYWLNVNGILALAAILDPRDKMESVEWYFEKIYGEDSFMEVDKVKSLLFALLHQYRGSNNETEGQEYVSSTFLPGKRQVSSDNYEDGFSLAKRSRKKKTNVRSELEYYLEEPAFPDCNEFDILNYWKSDLKYPTLRKIAKDILAFPASTVASESAFSMGGRVVSPHRSSLNVDTVEALMCLSSWICADYGENLDDLQSSISLLDDKDVEEASSGEMIKDAELDHLDGALSF